MFLRDQCLKWNLIIVYLTKILIESKADISY
jgi:hypothetical protein